MYIFFFLRWHEILALACRETHAGASMVLPRTSASTERKVNAHKLLGEGIWGGKGELC